MKALGGTFNQEKGLVGTFFMIVETDESFAALTITLLPTRDQTKSQMIFTKNSDFELLTRRRILHQYQFTYQVYIYLRSLLRVRPLFRPLASSPTSGLIRGTAAACEIGATIRGNTRTGILENI